MLLLVAVRRVRAALSGEFRPVEYALGESARVPARIVLANRNDMNLLELPVLFYVACVLGCVTGQASSAMVNAAWLYVALGVVHSLVHVTYNHVMHRFAAFAASNGVLIVMWGLLGHALASAAGS